MKEIMIIKNDENVAQDFANQLKEKYIEYFQSEFEGEKINIDCTIDVQYNVSGCGRLYKIFFILLIFLIPSLNYRFYSPYYLYL